MIFLLKMTLQAVVVGGNVSLCKEKLKHTISDCPVWAFSSLGKLTWRLVIGMQQMFTQLLLAWTKYV